ncbi:MAG TPA: type II and III secretion system protein [Gallionella sp.]
MRSCNMIYICAISVFLAGCGTKPIKPSDKHIQQQAGEPAATTGIPETVKRGVVLPPPQPVTKVETYSVVVTNVPAQEILFALARDARINLDIHPGIQGTVTVNAINQTLPQILTRIARQVDMRYELDNGYLTVMPDSPYLHNYKIDYVNMTRDSDGSISNSSLVGSAAGSAAGGAGSGGNSSSLAIKNTSKNHFWETLIQNIKDILHETDKILPAGSSETSVQQVREASSTGTGVQPSSGKKKSPDGDIEDSPNPVSVAEGGMTVTRRSTFREAASVIANSENGIITVRATGKQHEKIQEFIDQVMTSARRQVLIEATVVEVRLSDEYKQGIDWSRVALGGTRVPLTGKGFNLTQNRAAGLPTNTAGMFTLGYLNPTSKFGDLAASISLLESFGNVKVLSSPKLSVMNNQTAVLRVADNLVYFSMTVTPGTVNTLTGTMSTPPTYTSALQTSSVGFTMSLTPQINDSDTVLLNIRPSITRLLGYVDDPNPSLANPCLGIGTCAGVSNRIPQTSTREMESVLKIENNQTAVLGGLMEDRMDKLTDEVPLLARIPILGNLFQNRNDTTTKTELVIFLRPVVIKDADLNGDFSAYRTNLPDQDFFKESASGKP